MKLQILILIVVFTSCGINKLKEKSEVKTDKIQIFNKSNSDLISDNLTKILIDSNERIWIGTRDEGLVKFDGKEFTNYNKSNSLVEGYYIYDLYQDEINNIWISFVDPLNGTIKYNNDNWVQFPNDDFSELTFTGYPIFGDKKGNVYFCQIGSNEIIKYNGEEATKIQVPKKESENILAIDFDENGNIALGLTSGLILQKNGKWERLTTDNSELRLGTVRGIKYINEVLYIGYGGGFGDGGFSELKNGKWKHFNKTNSEVPDHMIRDFEVDSFGNIWMATNMGLIKLGKDGILKSLFFEKKGLGNNTIMDIAIDKKNTVWLATTSGLVKIEQ